MIVAGAGLAGLAAALAAHAFGVPVTVLEKAPSPGGASALAHGWVWNGTAGELVANAGGEAVPARLRALAGTLPAALDFYRAAGLVFAGVDRDPERLRISFADVLALVQSRGIDVRTGARVARLRRRDGLVCGVTLADGRALDAGDAVVLATGGYESDPVLVQRFEDVPHVRSAYPATSSGDGLRLGGSAGGRVRLIRNTLNVRLGFSSAPGRAATDELTRPHTFVVNRFGRTFGDWRDFTALAPALRAFDAVTRTFTNVPCWLVTGAAYAKDYGAIAGAVPVEQTPIDRDGLAATLAAARAAGPFQAVALHPSVTSSAGLVADADGRVMDWHGQAIAGLYAIGTVAAHDAFGAGYRAGYDFSSALTFAFRAVKHIADRGREST